MHGVEVLGAKEGDFDRFLYASVGDDRNGYAVTVLSTLARLGLDPWKEAGDLAALGREAAHTRLRTLLSAFRDVPTLRNGHGAVAQELILLLPQRPSLRMKTPAGRLPAQWSLASIGPVLAVLTTLLILAQMLFVGAADPGG